jgi:hypothetical protein
MNSILRGHHLELLIAIFSVPAAAQTAAPTTLLIDVHDHVEYQDDISDVTKFATIPTVTPSVNFRTFSVATMVADIVAVNGHAAMGVYTAQSRAVGSSPTAAAGFSIADVQRAAIREEVIEILNSDGTAVGTIVSLGLSGGPAPPGAPVAQTTANFAIVGGTGAFVGARGISGSGVSPQGVPARAASTAEDPSDRRVNGGGVTRRVLTIYPMESPEILAVTHSSDFSLVTSAKPAVPGENLSIFATGLGPTRPATDPGTPFPTSPLASVNSPLDVTLSGEPVAVIGAVGFPGSVNGYQVNVQVPSDAKSGNAALQLTAAWIAGSAVTIPVQ